MWTNNWEILWDNYLLSRFDAKYLKKYISLDLNWTWNQAVVVTMILTKKKLQDVTAMNQSAEDISQYYHITYISASAHFVTNMYQYNVYYFINMEEFWHILLCLPHISWRHLPAEFTGRMTHTLKNTFNEMKMLLVKYMHHSCLLELNHSWSPEIWHNFKWLQPSRISTKYTILKTRINPLLVFILLQTRVLWKPLCIFGCVPGHQTTTTNLSSKTVWKLMAVKTEDYPKEERYLPIYRIKFIFSPKCQH